MDYELRVIVEKVSITTQEVVQRDTLKVYAVKAPASILELGLRGSGIDHYEIAFSNPETLASRIEYDEITIIYSASFGAGVSAAL